MLRVITLTTDFGLPDPFVGNHVRMPSSVFTAERQCVSSTRPSQVE
jgi:S-adenosylmethionine hydrolase